MNSHDLSTSAHIEGFLLSPDASPIAQQSVSCEVENFAVIYLGFDCSWIVKLMQALDTLIQGTTTCTSCRHLRGLHHRTIQRAAPSHRRNFEPYLDHLGGGSCARQEEAFLAARAGSCEMVLLVSRARFAAGALTAIGSTERDVLGRRSSLGLHSTVGHGIYFVMASLVRIERTRRQACSIS